MLDSEIIALYHQRDEQAIIQTQNQYGAYCLTIAQRILQNYNDAEEVVSETWLKAWNTIPPQKPESLRFYLAKITRNQAIDCWRSRKRSGPVMTALEELHECVGTAPNMDAYIHAEELQKAINRFLRGQPLQTRNIFVRRYFFMEDVREISLRYQLKEANVHQILHRTREKLKKFLLQEGFML